MRIALVSLSLASLAVGLAAFVPAPAAEPERSPQAILESYVADFRADAAAATARTFGLRVSGAGGGAWTVRVSGEQDAEGHWGVELEAGEPKEPTFVYTVDAATLASIDAGRLNALTAQGKAWSDDVTPLAIEWVGGAQQVDVNAFSFHFWTRGFPERVPFRRELGREVHGNNMVVFYYQPGFRSAYSSIAKGQGANNGPGQPIVAPFPTLIFPISGTVQGTVRGEPVEGKAGEMIFIPPMTPHEWWNESDEPVEAILIFCGEGA